MILEDLGCVPAIHPSKIAVATAFGPLFLVAFLIFIFSCKCDHQSIQPALMTHLGLSSDSPGKMIFNLFRRAYASGPDALSRAHFLRMLSLCVLMGTYCPFIISLVLYRSVSLATLPWPSFAALHRHFPRILRIPLVVQPPALREMQLLFFWSYISSACIFVGILASGEEVRRDIVRACAFLTRKLATRQDGSHHKVTSRTSNDGSRMFSDMTTLAEIPIILINEPLYTMHTLRAVC
jgi:hypothetical protein